MGFVMRSRGLSPFLRGKADATALSYQDYAADIPTFGRQLREFYDAIAFTRAELDAIDALRTPLTIYAIVNERCTDAVASLPIYGRIAEHNSAISLKILLHSDHQELLGNYLGTDQRTHTPTYILADGNGAELGAMIGRPAAMTEQIREYATATYCEIAERFPGKTPAELPEEFVVDRVAQALETRKPLIEIDRAEAVAWLVDAANPGAGRD